MAPESDPVSGSVMAIAAHFPLYRASCSSDATDAIAALPRPWRGIDNSRPASPQHISIVPRTRDRFAVDALPDERRTPPAPAPPPDALRPSRRDASVSNSLGYVCSAWSYLRELGRRNAIAAWRAWSTRVVSFRGTSRLITPAPRLPSRPPHAGRGTTAPPGAPSRIR